MSKYIGRLVNLGLAKETVRGTAVSAAYWLPKTALAFFDRTNKATSQMAYGTIGEGAQAYKLNEWSEGSIETELNDRAFGLILLSAFGTVNTSGPTDSAYTHTFSIQADSQHDSLTITIATPDRTDQFSLCMLNNLEFTIVPDEVVMVKADFIGRTGRQVASASPSYATAFNKFLGRHASVKIASTTAGLGAASALSIKSMTLNIAKNVIQNNVIGTVWPEDILNRKFELTGEIELDYDDQTYRALMLDGTYKALRLNITNSDVLIGASSIPAFNIDLSRVHFEAWEPTYDNEEIVTQKIQFRALFDPTNGDIVNSCTLTNAVSSY
jgi:hypothetical protein